MTLVLLPGLDGTGRLFQPLIEALPPFLEPAVVSYPADDELGYDALLPLVLESLPVSSPFLLLGESFSGPLALCAAAAKPPGLRGVVLCASFITNPLPWLPAWGAPLVRPFLFRLLPAGAAARALHGWRIDPDLRALTARVLGGVPPRVLAARARAVLRVDASAELSRCAAPLLYLRGTRDRLVPRQNLRAVLAARPDTRVAALDASHMVLQERPSEAARAIAAFARELGGALP